MKTCLRGWLCLFLPSLFFVVFHAQAQQMPVMLTMERNNDNSSTIYADSRIYGNYTLKLKFTDLAGFKVTGMSLFDKVGVARILRGRSEVVRLTPDKLANRYEMRYRFSWYPGMALSHPPSDSTFLYLLPIANEHAVRISQVNMLEETFGPQPKSASRPAGFAFHLGDTICATRAGIVYETNDEVKEGETKNQVYRRERNTIHIQHRDGTLGHYSFRAPIHLLIAEGDEVMPGQPIAYFEKVSEYYTVFFSVNYLDERKMLAYTDDNNPVSPYTPVNIYFCTDPEGINVKPLVANTTMVAKQPAKLVAKELTRKEKKKLNLQ